MPRNVRPSHYDIVLQPDAEKLTFAGKVTISIEVLQATSSITLNAAGLSFAKAGLSADPDGATLPPPTVLVDEARQTATFSFEREIAPGRYRLALDYAGKIGSQAAGLFALDYDSAEGHKRALYTQFENSDARRVIPCWDEPAYKATFKLEAEIPAGQLAVSNMPAEETRDLGQGRSLVRFMTSPKMSTYLLFFGLGEFDRATAQAGGTEIGVVAKKGGAGQAAFRQRQRTFLQDFWLPIFGRVFHGDDYPPRPGHQVHGAAHALDHFARESSSSPGCRLHPLPSRPARSGQRARRESWQKNRRWKNTRCPPVR